MYFWKHKTAMVDAADALPGSPEPRFDVPELNVVLGTPQTAPAPAGKDEVWLGMGCFWGSEELYWKTPGVWTTAVGYAGGFTPNPTYEEVCSGQTGHAEMVRVVFDPAVVDFAHILKAFWENHDPTQDMRQGNDVGTQYRSMIICGSDAQLAEAEHTKLLFGEALREQVPDAGPITTEIVLAATLPNPTFYYAEPSHQQYLDKVPNGYRCHAATGIELAV